MRELLKKALIEAINNHEPDCSYHDDQDGNCVLSSEEVINIDVNISKAVLLGEIKVYFEQFPNDEYNIIVSPTTEIVLWDENEKEVKMGMDFEKELNEYYGRKND
jgi:hypothetical protein